MLTINDKIKLALVWSVVGLFHWHASVAIPHLWQLGLLSTAVILYPYISGPKRLRIRYMWTLWVVFLMVEILYKTYSVMIWLSLILCCFALWFVPRITTLREILLLHIVGFVLFYLCFKFFIPCFLKLLCFININPFCLCPFSKWNHIFLYRFIHRNIGDVNLLINATFNDFICTRYFAISNADCSWFSPRLDSIVQPFAAEHNLTWFRYYAELDINDVRTLKIGSHTLEIHPTIVNTGSIVYRDCKYILRPIDWCEYCVDEL